MQALAQLFYIVGGQSSYGRLQLMSRRLVGTGIPSDHRLPGQLLSLL